MDENNVLRKADFINILTDLNSKIKGMEDQFSGISLSPVRIADLGITNAKIVSVTADKITAGTLDVGEYILVGENILIGNGVVRITLPDPGNPGHYYDPFTDTNLDHYSLYSDVDNVLIKRKSTGSGSLSTPGGGGPGYNQATDTHSLGYAPMFLTYGKLFDLSGNYYWQLINNSYNPFQPPTAISAADFSSLYIDYFGGLAINFDYAYDIFYDNMNLSGTPSISESDGVIKVVRPGASINTLNPNDCIMHSDLNNFKIIKQAKKTSQTISNGLTTIAHGATVQAPYKSLVFMKFPDGKTALLGGSQGTMKSYDESKSCYVMMDGTNFYFRNFGSSFTADFFYIIYGSGVDGSESFSDPLIAVSDGMDIPTALADGNPDDFKFLSTKPSLKYFDEDSYQQTVTSTTVHTVAHSLGYVPVIIPFVKDFSALTNGLFGGSSVYALAPFYEGRSTIPSPNRDIGAYVYVDSSNIYLKSYYQTNAVGTSRTFDFYWKLFKNSTGL